MINEPQRRRGASAVGGFPSVGDWRDAEERNRERVAAHNILHHRLVAKIKATKSL